MKGKRCSEEQIIGILKQHESGCAVKELAMSLDKGDEASLMNYLRRITHEE